MSEVKETARPRFFKQPVQNMALSTKEGRPIFEDKTLVELKHPGDKSWSFVEEIDEHGCSLAKIGADQRSMDYSERFPREYAAFKKGEERATIGTPLDEWSQLPRSRSAELKAMNILTVEEYADVQDGMLQKLGMNSREEREKARLFIAASKGGADTAAMAAQIAQLQATVEALQQQAAPVAPQREKTLDECSDGELKDYIKRETGQGVPGNPKRETLLARAAEIAQGKAA